MHGENPKLVSDDIYRSNQNTRFLLNTDFPKILPVIR